MSDRTEQITVRLTKRELALLDRKAQEHALPGEARNRSRCIRQWLHNHES